MSYQVRFTSGARDDLRRLYRFLLEHDPVVAPVARDAIVKAMDFLCNFPFACRKAETDTPLLRELLIPFGRAGYVALFEIEDPQTVTILAIRHQREEDYY